MLLHFFIPFFIASIYCGHVSKNDSEVFVTYMGHAEAADNRPVFKNPAKKLDTVDKTKVDDKTEKTKTKDGGHDNEIIFIPNERDDYVRYDEVTQNNNVQTNRYNYRRMFEDTTTTTTARSVVIVSEQPHPNVYFITGRNNENVEPDRPKKKEKTSNSRRSEKETHNVKLDCSNLDCNITLNSVCGVKKENMKPKYRLFLNDCYFRKVNCAFNYEHNRYRQVPLERCKNVGSHDLLEKPYIYRPSPAPEPREKPTNDLRRAFSSRRAMSMSVQGTFCAHTCPVSCADDYLPQCAESATGQRKVFMNHCQMDYNSCFYGVVWQSQPLAVCVGGQLADLQQNRAFIGWMQRIGIVDGRGRLTLN